MAHPSSIGASIPALIEITHTITKLCYGYISNAKDAPKNIQQTINEVNSVRGVLGALQYMAIDARQSHLQVLELLSAPDGPLEHCKNVLEELSRRLHSVSGHKG